MINNTDNVSDGTDQQLNNKNDNISKEAVVIDLDNYEEQVIEKLRHSTKCINFECKSGENLRPAALFCLNYYRVKVKLNKTQEICADCYDAAIQYYECLSTALKTGECLIKYEQPIRDEFVEIDSDDEDTDVNLVDLCTQRVETCQLSEEVNELLMNDLPEVLNKMMSTHNIENQVDMALNHVTEKQKQLSSVLDELNKIEKDLQKRVDTVRSNIYECFQPKMEQLPSVDYFLNYAAKKTMNVSPPKREAERRSNRNITKPASYCELMEELDPYVSQENLEVSNEIADDFPSTDKNVLPVGPLVKPKLLMGEIYFAQRQSIFGAWGKVRLEARVETQSSENYQYLVKFEGKAKGQSYVKSVNGKQLAYCNPSSVRLEVGTRVIAVFADDSSKEAFFLGIVAEPLSSANQWRYLIFFDDGYAQYVPHEKIRVVCESNVEVWKDIHPDSQMFIRKYLESYPERPMVKLQPNQVVKTEWNGKWWIARVLQVDGSLVQMYFDADARTEWIYRGSARLGPLFLELQVAANRSNVPQGAKMRGQGQQHQQQPYVEYPRPQPGAPVRAVARKSTNRPPNTLPASETSTGGTIVPFLPSQQVQQPQSKVVYFTPKSVVTPKPFKLHECSPECGKIVSLPFSALKGYNPLSKPLLIGWHRQMCKYKGKKCIQYRAPCGRSIRSMPELHRYLRITNSCMSVDNFDFDFWVHCLAEFVLDKTYRSKRDISDGVENVPIPCVNYVDNSMPDFCNYSTKREPMEDVNLNLSEDFLCGCDCTDDCADRSKCACWQLTIREARTLNRRIPDELIGYTYKRLPDCVTTGIYECNSRCKCAATCLNRVVQHPLQLKLQLFKTANRGWGIRCLNDIPHGAFICIYAGSLLTDKMANEGGVNYGDEYLAELDYIEVVERQKDGYESDVTDIEDDDIDIDDNTESAQDGDEFRVKIKLNTDSTICTRSKKKNEENDAVTISDDDETIREKSSFAPQPTTEASPATPKFKSVRKMFGEDEVCYIMDAKNTGNIGRFLNHSCTPNVFVQNVFVDTHDLRFPWVAFFAMSYIRAGTELTWNYNYDVGSVPGKVIFCHCGSPDCRGRLL